MQKTSLRSDENVVFSLSCILVGSLIILLIVTTYAWRSLTYMTFDFQSPRTQSFFTKGVLG